MMMDSLGKRVSDHPKATVATIVLITGIAMACTQIFGIEQEFSEQSFMPDLEIVKASEEISEQYTTTYSVSILVKSRNGDLLTSDALAEMLEVENTIANDPTIRPTLENPSMPSVNVNSVADVVAQMALLQQGVTVPTMDQKVSVIRSMDDEQVKQLIGGILTSNQTPPMTKAMFSMMLTKDFDPAQGSFKAKGTIMAVSMNASMAEGMTMVAMGEESELSESERRMDEIVKAATEATDMIVLGTRLIMEEIMDANNESMAIILPIALGAVFLILAIIYRNGLDVLFSLLALGFAVIWVYGFGSAMGFTFNPMTVAVPVLIVGLGIDYGIHITMRYREEIGRGQKIEQSVRTAIGSVGVALLLATITTVVAFLSNMSSPIGLLGEFGILSAIGIIASFVIMITFVPACKQLRDLRKLGKENKNSTTGKANGSDKQRNRAQSVGVDVLNKAMSAGAAAAEHRPMVVIIAVVIVTAAAMVMASQLNTEFNFMDFLPKDLEISKSLDFMMTEFDAASSMAGETQEVDILVKGDMTSPDVLRGIGMAVQNMGDDEGVTKLGDQPEVQSILSFMADWATDSTSYGLQDPNYDSTFEAMYADAMTPTGVPERNATDEHIEDLYAWLYTNPQSARGIQYVLHRTEDNKFDSTVLRISTSVDIGDADAVEALHDDLNEDKQPLDESADRAVVTGGPILTKATMSSLNASQIRSMIITTVISLAILTVIYWYDTRSLVLGAITLTPVALCVAWTLGTMYLAGISLNVMTITIASLTIGLGVTYGIHITHRFLEDLGRHETIDAACLSTVSHTGTALFGAATTTIAGFGLLVFALMPPIQQFGAITALTILYSFLAAVFILPTFLVVWAKRQRSS